MSYRTVGGLKDDIAAILSGLNLANVNNLYGAFERAARLILQKVDIPEASGRQVYNIYDGVYDYPTPSTIFGSTFVDFRQQGENRNEIDYVYKKYISDFDRTKIYCPNGAMLTFEYIGGTGIMRVKEAHARNRIILDQMDSTSDTTNWTGAIGCSTPVEDATDYYQSPASLRFNITASGGTLTKTKSNTDDLTTYEGVARVFLALKMPSVNITSINLKLGNDVSNYWSCDATQGTLGAFTAGSWILVPFDLSGASETGTVDPEKVDYRKIAFTTDGTSMTNVRVGQIFTALPIPYELLYQTTAIFSASGVISETITDDNDNIILNPNAYTLYEYECATIIALQQGGGQASPLVQNLHRVLYGTLGDRNDVGLYAMYKTDNPSQELPMMGSWYD